MTTTSMRIVSALLLVLAVHPASADADPKKINACQEIDEPGSYVLAKNLTVSENCQRGLRAGNPSACDCLRIQPEFVTLDLNGFVITGGGAGRGIRTGSGAGQRGITVRNGTVTKFAIGIDFAITPEDMFINHARLVQIERMRLIDNGMGAVVQGAALVKDSLFAGSTNELLPPGPPSTDGPLYSGTGLRVGPGSVVSGNTFVGNAGDGLYAQGSGSTIVNNSATFNAGAGLVIECVSNILGNTATANGVNLVTNGGCNIEHNAIGP